MKKLINYLPFHFLLGLALGITLQFNYNIWQFDFIKLFLANTILLVIGVLLHQFARKIVFTIITFLLFVFIGITSVYIQNPKNYKNYYGHFSTKNSTTIITVDKVLKSGKFNNKYEAKVIQINNQKTVGRILLNIKKDSLQSQLNVNDQLLIKANFCELSPPLNPHQFDYKKYLSKRQIYQQVFVSFDEFKKLEKSTFSLIGLSAKIRNTVQKALKKYDFSKDEFAVINALLLGQRQELSKDLLQKYTNAGAIHILAISGLHIGILLLILSYIFKPLENLPKGKNLKALLIVLLLWVFAFIAGLSASVVRAVTMFTFVAIGQSLHKKQFVEHSLIASMFILLLVKPMFLFNVGFQLSYLAVFSIVWVQPLLYRLWQPKLKFIDKIWQLSTVSIAAQVGVLPISLYYFHQFPSLFLLSNLLIVPVLGGILIGGIIIIFLALLNILPQFIADFYGWTLSLMNQFVSWISHQEQFLFKQISMSALIMLAWYILIVFSYQFFIRRKSKQLIYALIAVVLLQSTYLFEKYHRNNKEEFLVFHKSRNSVIVNRKGNSLQLFSNLDNSTTNQQRMIDNYIIGEQVSTKITNECSKNIFQFKNQQILVVDSLGIYDIPVKNPIVLLQQSPKINLVRLIETLLPKKIIADGNNYKSYINRWKETCNQQKTPFYYTGQNGAFILSN